MEQAFFSEASLKNPDPLKERNPLKAHKKRVIVITGPTAAGKTKLSLSLAKTIEGEIISADSCQVYRGMDIGTAKATLEERALVPHHLIDICEITVPFNVAQFAEKASQDIEDVIYRGKVPIIVGGSGFYVHALLYGPPRGPPSDSLVRENLENQMDNLGPELLYQKLQNLDPEYAATISDKDRHKIVRALEIMSISGQRVSDFPTPRSLQQHEYDFRCWFIYPNREPLYSRIELRCDEMLENGFLDEVRALIDLGLCSNNRASQAIGYRQAIEFLQSSQSEADFESFKIKFKKATRHFAKRQFTWFRKEPLFRWLNTSENSEERIQELILQDFEHGEALM